MSKMNETFANNALKYVGQGPNTFRKWYYGNSGAGIPWCAIFVSYVAYQTGISNKLIYKSAGSGDIARTSVKKGWGKWYEGYEKPQVGDVILFTWNNLGYYPGQDKYFSDHVGIVYKVDSSTVYTVEGNTNSNSNDRSVVAKHQYKLGSGVINGYYRPAWSGSISEPVTVSIPSVTYRVKSGGKWGAAVTDMKGCAGTVGKPITDIAVKFGQGTCKYRVHVKSTKKWLPWVTGYNINDYNNGYAGNGKEIDAIQIYYTTPSNISTSIGVLRAKYHVSPVKSGYYSYQYDTETTNGQDGYAGSFGKSIDRLQIILSK